MVASPPRPITKVKHTVADLGRFPGDGRLRELVDGEIVEWDTSNRMHGYYVSTLSRLLGNVVVDANLGILLAGDPLIRIQSSDHDARGPDLCFYARARIPNDLTASVGDEPPDFVIEILSPTDRAGEVQRKVVDWLRAGVRLLWYVDPETGITTVYHNARITSVGPEEDLDGADVLPGFQLRLRSVFDQLASLQAQPE